MGITRYHLEGSSKLTIERLDQTKGRINYDLSELNLRILVKSGYFKARNYLRIALNSYFGIRKSQLIRVGQELADE